jgi:hypothetical protein
MPDIDPVAATGLVFIASADRHVFAGTCAALFTFRTAITAAHCVRGVDISALSIQFPRRNTSYRVASISEHPTADLAVIRADVREDFDPQGDCFKTIVETERLAEEFSAYGYPTEGPTPIAAHTGEPTPRAFRGYYQRFLDHASHLGYAYPAVELNIAVPEGLSGGPLFKLGWGYPLVGLATENIEMSTAPFSYEEEHTPGEVKRVEGHRVIAYGIGMLLHQFEPWLRSEILR